MANELARCRQNLLRVLLLADSLEPVKKKKKRERVVWARAWLKRREERGVFHLLMCELELEDAAAFTRYVRMEKNKFDDLVDRVGAKVMKQTTNLRSAICPGERIAVTLRYLATSR